MKKFFITFAYLFQTSLALTPSKGCDTTLPDVPFPGHHADFHVDYDDKLHGIVNRFYVLGLPKSRFFINFLVYLFNSFFFIQVMTILNHFHSFSIFMDGQKLPMDTFTTLLGPSWSKKKNLSLFCLKEWTMIQVEIHPGTVQVQLDPKVQHVIWIVILGVKSNATIPVHFAIQWQVVIGLLVMMTSVF